MVIISVVRNFKMYNRLVKDNPFNQGARFVCFDNSAENKTITARYNSFLDSYDYSSEDWFVFCHEDWEIKEQWQSKLATLDKNSIYGPIGTSGFCLSNHHIIKVVAGEIINSDKNAEKILLVGTKVHTGHEVQTLDCQCVIVHSSLVKKYKLRFDKNLSFDLYVEDFCANAREKFKIKTKIFQLKCQHYSFGHINPEFYDKLTYLKQKYANAKLFYSTTVIEDVFGRVRFRVRSQVFTVIFIQKIRRFFFQKKITHSNNKCIKICRIQLPQTIARKVWK